MGQKQTDILIAAVEQWETLARRKYADAAQENDPMGKRLIEHGAVCLANCAREIRATLNACDLQPLAIPTADQRKSTSRV
jgi:hypothetical protein